MPDTSSAKLSSPPHAIVVVFIVFLPCSTVFGILGAGRRPGLGDTGGVPLPASSFGAKARDIDYTFEIRYAKDKAVGWEAKPEERLMEMDYAKAAAAPLK